MNGHEKNSALYFGLDGTKDDSFYWSQCPRCKNIDIAYKGLSQDLLCCEHGIENVECHNTLDLIRAYMAARSARF